MIKVVAHGAGQEVGRSCIEVQKGNKRIIFDAGIKIRKEGNEFPTTIKNIKEVQALFLSHAHMDHSGALPSLRYQGLRCPIMTNSCTKDITRILLQDSWKIDRIENRELTYKKDVIGQVLDSMILQHRGMIKGIPFTLHPTGHIPGSSAVLIHLNGTRILYSGDVNGTTTHLLEGINKMPEADVLILESTYGHKNHPDRKKTEAEFIKVVKDTLKNRGVVLCPAFAVGRAQEIMIMLHKAGIKAPIYLDGMSRKVLSVFLKHRYELKDHALEAAAKKVEPVTGWQMRKKLAQKPCVIIATSGMMDAGPVLGYAKQIYHKKNCSILLTGYQAEGTKGRHLLETGMLPFDEKTVPVDAYVEHFDFSAHASQKDLRSIIDSVRPKHLILNHGEELGEKALAEYAEKKGIKAHMPKTGQTITLSE